MVVVVVVVVAAVAVVVVVVVVAQVTIPTLVGGTIYQCRFSSS